MLLPRSSNRAQSLIRGDQTTASVTKGQGRSTYAEEIMAAANAVTTTRVVWL